MTDSFSELLAKARDGCPRATEQLYAIYAKRLFTVVRRRIGSRLRQKFDSGDVIQSVFVEVLRDLPRFEDRGELAFRHWLYIKTENKVRSKYRKYLRIDETQADGHSLPDSNASPVTRADNADQHGRARAFYDRLDGASREIVAMRLEREMGFEAIAKALNLASADAARKRYSRAIAKLRTLARRLDNRDS